jgi:recombination protein RecA
MDIREKLKSVRAAMADIEKQFGRGAIMLLGGEDRRPEEPIAVVPSGSIGVDRALGVGGIPRGRIVEIFGPESSGKTTLALHVIAKVQKLGGVAAFVDAEHALDPRYAQALGINLEHLLVSQPDTGEQALEIVETLVRSAAVDLVVVDSVAALVPKAEIEGEMGDSHMGLQARLMSQAMRKLTGHAAKTRSMLIFINQIRQKIGVTFGSPETTTGGNALKFYCSVRLDIRRIGSVKESETVIGNRVRVRVVKNKLAPPFREAEFDVLYGHGVSTSGEIVDIAVEHNLIEKAGAWYSLAGVRIGQGRDKAKQWFEERPQLMERMRALLLQEKPEIQKLGPPESFDQELTRTNAEVERADRPEKAEKVEKVEKGGEKKPNGEARSVRAV